jgi:hypothetical protein
MPRYIDVHRELRLPQEVASQIQASIREGRTDPATGVKVLNVYANAQSGRCFCFLEAPDIQAVREYHERAGVALEEVTDVQGLV